MATDSDKSRYQLGVWQWLVSVTQPTGVQSLSLTSSSRLLTFLRWDNSSSDPCTTWLLNPGCYLSSARPSSSPEVLGYRIYFCLFYGAASARVESRCLLMCEQETGLRVWFVLELQRWKWHVSSCCRSTYVPAQFSENRNLGSDAVSPSAEFLMFQQWCQQVLGLESTGKETPCCQIP